MGEVTKFDALSRRKVFSLLGLAVTTSVLLPSTLLTVEDAVAQQAQPPQPMTPPPPFGQPATPQTGTERRQERRTGRVKRRKSRRTTRQKGRTERRAVRRGTSSDTNKQ
jgi:hypothetical protein